MMECMDILGSHEIHLLLGVGMYFESPIQSLIYYVESSSFFSVDQIFLRSLFYSVPIFKEPIICTL
jgi:hypothetical protein